MIPASLLFLLLNRLFFLLKREILYIMESRKIAISIIYDIKIGVYAANEQWPIPTCPDFRSYFLQSVKKLLVFCKDKGV